MITRTHAILFALLGLAISLALIACDPPHFAWPERIPEVKAVDNTRETPYDSWKARRMADPNPTLVAGAAIVDLTPANPQGTFIAGYMPNKKATGTDGKITGRILFLDDGKQSVVMIGLDFVGFMNDRVWNVRHRTTKKYPGDLLIASTHTHAGPDTMGLWGSWAFFAVPVQSGINEAYMDRVETDLAEGIWRAQREARPAELFASSVVVPQGISENAHKPGFKDDEMVVLQARDTNGQPIATLVNYACHAEFLGQNNSLLSADFPRFLYDELERREGGVAVFMNGALGGLIVPAMPRRTENVVHLRRKGAIRAGKTLAGLASESLKQGEKLNVSAIAVEHAVLTLPVENETFAILGKKDILKRTFKDDALFSEVVHIQLGTLGIVSVPGEIFPSLGFAIKKRMDEKYKIIAGLGNDELGYIMNAQEWTEDTYEYERTVSVGSQTGPLLLDAINKLYASTP